MDQEAKKKSLRMITYGLYILAVKDGEELAAGTVNWLSQASFTPPLIMVGVKKDSHLHTLIEKPKNLRLVYWHRIKKYCLRFFPSHPARWWSIKWPSLRIFTRLSVSVVNRMPCMV